MKRKMSNYISFGVESRIGYGTCKLYSFSKLNFKKKLII